jgi:L-serine dehydratase
MESITEIYRIGHGPSSSHTMGPQRAANKFKTEYPDATHFICTLYGSLAATGKGHLTDQAIIETFAPKPVTLEWQDKITLPLHPNGMIFKALDDKKNVLGQWTGYSIGGGAIRSDKEYNSPPPSIYPLTSMDEILNWHSQTGKNLWEYVKMHEDESNWPYLERVWQTMKNSITQGLDNEGLLPGTLRLQRKAASYKTKSVNSSHILGEIGSLSAYALAVSEENASCGKVVTAPTCGSAGVVPATLYFLKESYGFSDQRIHRALATAGLIGNLVKENASISGAEVGCQGEIGTACAMAAAAATQLLGGTVTQIEYAAEMGIEHHLGLTCDPVEGYVQIPCIERNAAGAVRAIQCASYSIMSDGNHRISFDEVVQTMKETGADMDSDYKETSISGLAKNWQASDQHAAGPIIKKHAAGPIIKKHAAGPVIKKHTAGPNAKPIVGKGRN